METVLIGNETRTGTGFDVHAFEPGDHIFPIPPNLKDTLTPMLLGIVSQTLSSAHSL